MRCLASVPPSGTLLDVPGAEPEPADRLNVALAEFNALRAEILSRSTSQQNLLNLTLVATGAIGSVAFSDTARQPVLLVVPIISCIFGMLYFDHGFAIGNIGRYIRDELTLAVRTESGWPHALGWEDFVRRSMAPPSRFHRGTVQFSIPILFAFLFIPTVISVYMATQLTNTWLWLAWSIGIIAEILTATIGLAVNRRWAASSRTERTGR
jgi:hypothetical protein